MPKPAASPATSPAQAAPAAAVPPAAAAAEGSTAYQLSGPNDGYTPGSTRAHEQTTVHPGPVVAQDRHFGDPSFRESPAGDLARQQALQQVAENESNEMRRNLYYAGAAVGVCLVTWCAVWLQSSARSGEVARARRTYKSLTKKLKIDLRARSSSGRVPAAYVQMAVPSGPNADILE